MIARAQFGKFASSGAAHKKQNAGALTLCLINAERGSAPLAARRNRHQELARSRHINQLRSVKTKEDHAGRELRCVGYDNIVHCRHRLWAFSQEKRHTAVTEFLTISATFD
jgi:hypothetical protein